MNNRNVSGRSRRAGRWGGAALASLLVALAVLTVAGSAQVASQAAESTAPAAALSLILDRLHGALDALDARVGGVGWTGVRKELEEARALLEPLIQEAGASPAPEKDSPTARDGLVKLDLVLHRLVGALERLVESAPPGDGRSAGARAKETLSDLRVWVDGYVASVAARPERLDPSEFGRLARLLLREVESRLQPRDQAGARGASPDPKLEALVREIEGWLDRLNEFVLRSLLAAPREGSSGLP